jgi:hypothetical protein
MDAGTAGMLAYATETKAVIFVQWGLLLIAVIALANFGVENALLRYAKSKDRRNAAAMSRLIGSLKAEVAAQKLGLAEVSAMKDEIRRLTAIVAEQRTEVTRALGATDGLRRRRATDLPMPLAPEVDEAVAADNAEAADTNQTPEP